MDRQMEKQRQGRAEFGRVPARRQGTSFGSLRNERTENFGKQRLARNTRDLLDHHRSERRDLTALPTEYGGFVDGRPEELAEFLKGHSVVLLTITGYGRGDCRFGVHGGY